MRRKVTRLVSLLLAAALLLCGCNGIDYEQLWGVVEAQLATPFADMEYVRPDMDKMEALLEDCCQRAETETDADVLAKKALEFYSVYNSFYTQYNLATIHYFKDMTDSYWEKEYAFCQGQVSVAQAALEKLLCTLAESPQKDKLEENPAFGEGFFDAYMGGGLWDEPFAALMNAEAELENQYIELCAQTPALYAEEYFAQYAQPMGELLVELVKVRQRIAAYAGYADYASFAYDYYYYGGYSPKEIAGHLEKIQQELVPLYRLVESQGVSAEDDKICREKDAFAYMESAAKEMGGPIQNAFLLMKQAKLYDITYSEKKYSGSFETYLPDYYVPYLFVSPVGTQRDKLSFAHEFGHFCNDYAAGGSVAGVNVAEFFSQGMEYLSLCYGEEAGALVKMKLRDCLRIYVEQAAYALFEQRLYSLTGDELTLENVQNLYREIGLSYGFDVWNWDSRDYIMIGHFFTDPMYIVSYVVSNDVALQLYQLEKATPGAGRDLFEAQLATRESQLPVFVQAAGLKNPLESGRLAEVRKTLEEMIIKNEGLLSRPSFFIFVVPDKSAKLRYLPG